MAQLISKVQVLVSEGKEGGGGGGGTKESAENWAAAGRNYSTGRSDKPLAITAVQWRASGGNLTVLCFVKKWLVFECHRSIHITVKASGERKPNPAAFLPQPASSRTRLRHTRAVVDVWFVNRLQPGSLCFRDQKSHHHSPLLLGTRLSLVGLPP